MEIEEVESFLVVDMAAQWYIFAVKHTETKPVLYSFLLNLHFTCWLTSQRNVRWSCGRYMGRFKDRSNHCKDNWRRNIWTSHPRQSSTASHWNKDGPKRCYNKLKHRVSTGCPLVISSVRMFFGIMRCSRLLAVNLGCNRPICLLDSLAPLSWLLNQAIF